MHFREPPPNSYETADWRLRKKNKRQPIKNLPRLPGGEDLFFLWNLKTRCEGNKEQILKFHNEKRALNGAH